MKNTINTRLQDLWEDYWTGSDYHEGIRAAIRHAQRLLDKGLTPLITAEHLLQEASAIEVIRGERLSKGWMIEGRINGLRKAANLIQG